MCGFIQVLALVHHTKVLKKNIRNFEFSLVFVFDKLLNRMLFQSSNRYALLKLLDARGIDACLTVVSANCYPAANL